MRAHQPEGDVRGWGCGGCRTERIGERVVVVVGRDEPDRRTLSPARDRRARRARCRRVAVRRKCIVTEPQRRISSTGGRPWRRRRRSRRRAARRAGRAARSAPCIPGRHRVAGGVVAGGHEQGEEVVELVLGEYLAVDLRRQQVADDVVGRVRPAAAGPAPGRSGTARCRPGCGTASAGTRRCRRGRRGASVNSGSVLPSSASPRSTSHGPSSSGTPSSAPSMRIGSCLAIAVDEVERRAPRPARRRSPSGPARGWPARRRRPRAG